MADLILLLRPVLKVAGILLLVVAGALALLQVWAMFQRPRLDRDWVEHLSQMPVISRDGDRFSLAPAYDWTYSADGPVARDMTSAAEAIGEIRNVWFVVEPHPGLQAMAHTLLLFEFPDDRIIGLTIEARREADESYSAFWGTFNRFELAYIWATAKDLLTRRAVFLKHDVMVFPLALDDGQKRALLTTLLARTEAVSTRARFYNTLFSNCTNELAKSAKLAWHSAFILTGYSPERLFELKLIPGASVEDARRRATVTDDIIAANSLPSREFDRRLLALLRERAVAAPQ